MSKSQEQTKENFIKLIEIMAQLRNPDGGCPWDLEQDFKSIIPYTLEEAYEVADAIERDDYDDLVGELGDLLLQVVFYAQMAFESSLFTMNDVLASINHKMISRHPHVFGEADAATAEAVLEQWDAIKDKENAKKGADTAFQSAVSTVALGLPALLRAQKLAKKAAKSGFTFRFEQAYRDKYHEEFLELLEAIASGDPKDIEEEFGDVLFCLVNWARSHDVSAEEALRKTNDKFVSRFSGMEKEIFDQNRAISDYSAEELRQLWLRQKEKEKTAKVQKTA